MEHLRNVCLSRYGDPDLTMWADWEILRSKQSRGQLRYVDPRVVCEIDNIRVTSYKNITLIEVDSIVDAEIASHIFDSSILVLSLF